MQELFARFKKVVDVEKERESVIQVVSLLVGKSQ